MSSHQHNPAAAKQHDSNGSRESSEFEFVMRNSQQQANNPLMLASNQAALLPTPGLPSPSIIPPAEVVKPASPAAQLIQPPASPPQPRLARPQSMAVPYPPPSNSSSSSVDMISTTVSAESPPAPGVFGWVKGTGFLSKVMEKTKTVTENVITTLDPQMKEFMHSGGSIEVVVASDKEDKVIPVKEAFQQVFGKATVYGLPSKSISIAEQPVGFASGKQAALERISTLRKSGSVGPQSVVVSVENFLYEVNEDLWIDLSCLVLSDPLHKIQLQTFSQPTPLDNRFIKLLKDGTPDNYPRQWSGFGVAVGNVMSAELNVPHTSWQEAVTGVHRKELLLVAGRALAGLYRRALQGKVEDV